MAENTAIPGITDTLAVAYILAAAEISPPGNKYSVTTSKSESAFASAGSTEYCTA